MPTHLNVSEDELYPATKAERKAAKLVENFLFNYMLVQLPSETFEKRNKQRIYIIRYIESGNKVYKLKEGKTTPRLLVFNSRNLANMYARFVSEFVTPGAKTRVCSISVDAKAMYKENKYYLVTAKVVQGNFSIPDNMML